MATDLIPNANAPTVPATLANVMVLYAIPTNVKGASLEVGKTHYVNALNANVVLIALVMAPSAALKNVPDARQALIVRNHHAVDLRKPKLNMRKKRKKWKK